MEEKRPRIMNQKLKNNLLGAIVEVPSLIDNDIPCEIGFLVKRVSEEKIIVESSAGNQFEITRASITKIYPFDKTKNEYIGL